MQLYSILIFAARTTFPHFAISFLMRSPNSDGVVAAGSKPSVEPKVSRQARGAGIVCRAAILAPPIHETALSGTCPALDGASGPGLLRCVSDSGPPYRHFSSRSRRTASLAGFFDLGHAFDGPLRYGASTFFDTMPSRPMRQT